jgi:nucleotide-binding universal stress UspA family protein
MISPKLICAPVDFSEYAKNAVDTAADIAKKYGAEVLLLHVVPFIPDLPSSISLVNETTYENDLLENARTKLAEVASAVEATGVTAKTAIGMANEAGDEILRQVQSNGADLVVIATHGMTGWRRLAFGSVAKKVVEEATVPVLVLRIKGESEKQEEERAASA